MAIFFAGMYIASTKPGGFQLEATNNDSTLVICGIRIAVGAVDTQRVPAFLEVGVVIIESLIEVTSNDCSQDFDSTKVSFIFGGDIFT